MPLPSLSSPSSSTHSNFHHDATSNSSSKGTYEAFPNGFSSLWFFLLPPEGVKTLIDLSTHVCQCGLPQDIFFSLCILLSYLCTRHIFLPSCTILGQGTTHSNQFLSVSFEAPWVKQRQQDMALLSKSLQTNTTGKTSTHTMTTKGRKGCIL